MAKGDNPQVAIGASVGGITLVMIIVIVLFAKGSEWIIPIVVGAMAFMGIMLGLFAKKR